MITIGQLAGYAGVTVKTVRHYHKRGLLPEPPRDAAGYRRYGVDQAIALIKIRTLATAGVPLSRVKELLAAGPDQFAEAVADIDGRLRQQIQQLQDTRQRVTRLRAGDELFVSADIAEYLSQLEDLGISQRVLQVEQDIWVLMHAVAPDDAAVWAAAKLKAIADPQFRAIYREYDAAFDWPADDPRLPALADRTREWLRTAPSAVDHPPTTANPAIVRMLGASDAFTSPGWNRLAALVGSSIR